MTVIRRGRARTATKPRATICLFRGISHAGSSRSVGHVIPPRCSLAPSTTAGSEAASDGRIASANTHSMLTKLDESVTRDQVGPVSVEAGPSHDC
jgi:hypothetical protein